MAVLAAARGSPPPASRPDASRPDASALEVELHNSHRAPHRLLPAQPPGCSLLSAANASPSAAAVAPQAITLADEWRRCEADIGLSRAQMRAMSEHALDAAFCTEDERAALRLRVAEWHAKCRVCSRA